MAYIPTFENDIFISYAHVDDQKDPGQPEGWVGLFHKHLEVALSRQLGRMHAFKIWRDTNELVSNDYFETVIRQKINSSAIFLSLTSHGYLHPEGYSLKELRWFHQQAQAANSPGLMIGTRSRIVNLLLYNIPFNKWPTEYTGTSGHPFYDTQGANAEAPVLPTDQLFIGRVRLLAKLIIETLDAIRQLSMPSSPIALPPALITNTEPGVNVSLTMPPPSTPPPAPAAKTFTIYLADTADSLRPVRRRVISELQQQNDLNIISDVPPPWSAQQHEERVIAEIGKAHLAVHLLNDVAGREIEGDPGKSYVQKQIEIGMQHAKSQLIWVPKTLDFQAIEDDENYGKFLDQLENGERGNATYNFVRESPAAISQRILDKINQLKAASEIPQGVPAAVLLDTHLKDQLYALDLSRFLIGKNVIPYINPEEDDPQKNIELFQKMLKLVSVLVIIFGAVTAEWVRERLVTALKIAIAENYPLKLCGIYLAPNVQNGAQRQFDLGEFPESVPVVLFKKPESFTTLLNNALER